VDLTFYDVNRQGLRIRRERLYVDHMIGKVNLYMADGRSDKGGHGYQEGKQAKQADQQADTAGWRQRRSWGQRSERENLRWTWPV